MSNKPHTSAQTAILFNGSLLGCRNRLMRVPRGCSGPAVVTRHKRGLPTPDHRVNVNAYSAAKRFSASPAWDAHFALAHSALRPATPAVRGGSVSGSDRGDRASAGCYAERGVDAPEVCFYCRLTDAEATGDLLVGTTRFYEFQDLYFTRRERVDVLYTPHFARDFIEACRQRRRSGRTARESDTQPR
jgi:hypothetical protein